MHHVSLEGPKADNPSLTDAHVDAIFGAQMMDPIKGAEQLAEAGVHRAMVPAFFFAGPGGMDRLAEFGQKVVGPLSA